MERIKIGREEYYEVRQAMYYNVTLNVVRATIATVEKH